MLFSPPKTWSLASWGDSSVLYCTSCAADKNHIVRRIYAPSFLEHGLVFQWMDLVNSYQCFLLYIYVFGIKINPFKLEKLETTSSNGKKNVANSMCKAHYSWMQVMTLKATSQGTFWDDFIWNCIIFSQIKYEIVWYTLEFLFIKFFSSKTFKNPCF